MTEELVTVATYQWPNEAEMAKFFLAENGIQAFVIDAEVIRMDWFLGNAVGNVKLRVRSSQAEPAAAILAKWPKRFAAAGAETTDDSLCLSCGANMPDDASECPACGWSIGQPEYSDE